MPFPTEELQRFPTHPGVYLMKDAKGKVIYVGKAKNLRNRVKQYFIPGRDGRAMVPYLTVQVESIDTIVVTSEKEALILENNLIKKHRPKYNALLKDDKTYFSLMVNHKHRWPRVCVARFKGKPPPGNLYFGPYTQGYAAKQTLELLRMLFPLRQCSDRELESRTRPCILYEMKKCVAPCVEKCSKESYDKLVSGVVSFLKGHDATIRNELKAEMQKAMEDLEFERAERIFRTLRYIESTLEKQVVEKAGLKDLDVIGLCREGERVALAQLLFREGKLISSQGHVFPKTAQDDEGILTSFLLQQYSDQELLPAEIVLPKKVSLELEALLHVKLTTPSRGNKRALLEMAAANAEAKMKQEPNTKEQTLLLMEEVFHLTNYPEQIECFDNSNLSGSEPVGAMVAFINGEKSPQRYRKYKIKAADRSDDYGAMKEVLTRRMKRAKEEEQLPDMLLIDGGRGHLNLTVDILEDLDITTVDVVAIAKEKGRHDRGATREKVYLREVNEALLLPRNSPLLFLIQQIRDEAHRFAITFQRERRKKQTFASPFDSLSGIGPVKKKRLIVRFGSWKRLLAASETEWKEVKGITQRDVETLRGRKEEEHQNKKQS